MVTRRGQEGHRLRDPAGGNYNNAGPNDPDPETKRRQALAGALSVPTPRVGSAHNLNAPVQYDRSLLVPLDRICRVAMRRQSRCVDALLNR
jgi:hypothetical protein